MKKVIVHGALYEPETQRILKELYAHTAPDYVIVFASITCKESFLYKHCASFKSIVNGGLKSDYMLYFCKEGVCGLPTTTVNWE